MCEYAISHEDTILSRKQCFVNPHLTRQVLADDLISEVDQKRYSLLFVRLAQMDLFFSRLSLDMANTLLT